MQISLTTEAQPFKKTRHRVILTMDGGPTRQATFAYDGGATLQKHSRSPWDPYDGWPATDKQ